MATITVYTKENSQGTRFTHNEADDIVRDGILIITYRRSGMQIFYPLHNILKWEIQDRR